MITVLQSRGNSIIMYLMKQPLIDFLNEELKKRGWSGREFGRRADVSHDTIARILRGESLPEPETLRKFATALGHDESYLLRLAGHLEETPRGLTDPNVIALAQRLEELSPEERERVLRALYATIEAVVPITPREEARRAILEGRRGQSGEATE